AALNVVGLNRQKLLQRIGCAVSFQSPHFHLTEALTTKLRLTTQRLLGNQRVRADGAGVHLVVNQVSELEHVHNTDGNQAVKRLTSCTVKQANLSGRVHVEQFLVVRQ